jgi:hypothetical protein
LLSLNLPGKNKSLVFFILVICSSYYHPHPALPRQGGGNFGSPQSSPSPGGRGRERGIKKGISYTIKLIG